MSSASRNEKERNEAAGVSHILHNQLCFYIRGSSGKYGIPKFLFTKDEVLQDDKY